MLWTLPISLLLILVSPGIAILALTPLWDFWRGLQRIIIVVSIGLAFYPILFYLLTLLPGTLTLGPRALIAIILASWLVAAIRKRMQIISLWRLQKLEVLAVVIFLITFFTRYYIAYYYPYPAWTDSVHHVILTKLIAESGALPATLEPYYPIPLDMYHLGLHALAATLVWLSRAEPHTALLWTAQTLNAMCGWSIYLVLDRKASRVGAITGAAIVGLFSYQPAFYVNWGRFTQVAAQALLLTAWLVTHETIRYTFSISKGKGDVSGDRKLLGGLILFSGLLTASLVAYHLRVAIFYILLLIPSTLYIFFSNGNIRQRWATVVCVFVGIAATAGIFSFPILRNALLSYLRMSSQPLPSTVSPSQYSELTSSYFSAQFSQITALAGQNWLLILATVCVILGLFRRDKLTVLATIWLVSLIGLGQTYLLKINLLNVVNITGVAILFYIPLGIILGSTASYLFSLGRVSTKEITSVIYASCLVIATLPFAWQRIHDIESFRFFITSDDIQAMRWIEETLPQHSLFAVNADFWLPTIPVGTDAGYGLPYFANQSITAAPMLGNLAPLSKQNAWIENSRLVLNLNDDPTSVQALGERGVNYIYLGATDHYVTDKELDAEKLKHYTDLRLLYDKNGVSIFEILLSR